MRVEHSAIFARRSLCSLRAIQNRFLSHSLFIRTSFLRSSIHRERLAYSAINVSEWMERSTERRFRPTPTRISALFFVCSNVFLSIILKMLLVSSSRSHRLETNWSIQCTDKLKASDGAKERKKENIEKFSRAYKQKSPRTKLETEENKENDEFFLLRVSVQKEKFAHNDLFPLRPAFRHSRPLPFSATDLCFPRFNSDRQ